MTPNVNAVAMTALLPGQTATFADGVLTVSPPPPCVGCWEPIKDHWYRIETGSIYPPTGTYIAEWTPPVYCSAACVAKWAAGLAGGIFTQRTEQAIDEAADSDADEGEESE